MPHPAPAKPPRPTPGTNRPLFVPLGLCLLFDVLLWVGVRVAFGVHIG
jgi:hypothetical protein